VTHETLDEYDFPQDLPPAIRKQVLDLVGPTGIVEWDALEKVRATSNGSESIQYRIEADHEIGEFNLTLASDGTYLERDIDLPQSVQKVVQSTLGSAEVEDDISTERRGEEVIYTVRATKDDTTYLLKISTEGTLLSKETV